MRQIVPLPDKDKLPSYQLWQQRASGLWLDLIQWGGGDQEKIINHSTLSMFRMNPSTPKRLSNVRLAIKRNSILCV